MTEENVKVLITGGGTGGHAYPAIVIADEIRRLNPAARILFVGTKRGLESKVVPPLGYEIKFVDVRYLIRRITLKNFVTIYKALTSVIAAKKIIREFDPDIVVGTGGYVSGPVVFAATLLKIPTLIHEQNAFPGLTTRLLSRRVTRVAVSHGAAVKGLKSGAAVVVTGHPVRREFFEGDSRRYREQMGLRDKQKLVLVVGGSGGALKLNQVILEAAKDILADPDVILMHITGSRYYQRVMEEWERQDPGPDLRERYRIIDYHHNMPQAMGACDLIVARAGGMVHEMTVSGCPALLVPSPNVTDDHQLHNARAMEDAGAALVIEEHQLTVEKFTTEIRSLVEDSERLKKMSAAAKALGKPEAGSRLAKIALEMAKKK
jgi:UDP-N-acetylglucosamine--N-acetylmuramyl-(pentapeptide) pyrophosphoryl-undecaprenol N-acetylglucosamine transferase